MIFSPIAFSIQIQTQQKMKKNPLLECQFCKGSIWMRCRKQRRRKLSTVHSSTAPTFPHIQTTPKWIPHIQIFLPHLPSSPHPNNPLNSTFHSSKEFITTVTSTTPLIIIKRQGYPRLENKEKKQFSPRNPQQH